MVELFYNIASGIVRRNATDNSIKALEEVKKKNYEGSIK